MIRGSHRVSCQICMLKKIQRGSATRMAISDLYPPKAEDCFSMICMKSSPVIPCGAWSSNPLKFLWYLYFLLKYDYFSIFSFLTVNIYIMKNVYQYFTEDSLDSPELRSVGIFWTSLTFFQIWIFHISNFWQCALQCIKNMTLKEFFCTYSVVKLIILKINWIFFSAERWDKQVANSVYFTAIRL